MRVFSYSITYLTVLFVAMAGDVLDLQPHPLRSPDDGRPPAAPAEPRRPAAQAAEDLPAGRRWSLAAALGRGPLHLASAPTAASGSAPARADRSRRSRVTGLERDGPRCGTRRRRRGRGAGRAGRSSANWCAAATRSCRRWPRPVRRSRRRVARWPRCGSSASTARTPHGERAWRSSRASGVTFPGGL